MSTAVSDCIHEKCVIERNELEIVTDKAYMYDRNGYHPSERVDRNGRFCDRNGQFEDRNGLLNKWTTVLCILYMHYYKN